MAWWNFGSDKPQRKIDELDQRFKITIDNGESKVEAPLHDDFGFTVGSEFTTPFDVGTATGILQKAMAVSGLNSPLGLRMKKMYANPEPMELSFKMSFDAYYDALEEVAKPVIQLLTMGLGSELNSGDVDKKIKKLGALIETATNIDPLEGISKKGVSSKMLGMIKLIKSPETCGIRFGTFITIDSAFITSASVSFSNVVDENGIPMRADVNVTCTLQTAPIAEDVFNFFSGE